MDEQRARSLVQAERVRVQELLQAADVTAHCARERQRSLQLGRIKRDKDRIGTHARAVLVRHTLVRKRFAALLRIRRVISSSQNVANTG